MGNPKPGKFAMPFGKFAGLSLDRIGKTDDGLKYLGWLSRQAWLEDGPLKTSLAAYLGQSRVARRLEELEG